MRNRNLDKQLFLRHYEYDENTGNFYKVDRVPGTDELLYRSSVPAGSINQGHGCRVINFRGRNYLVHHLVWMCTYGFLPAGNIRHIDGNKLNNHRDNLAPMSGPQPSPRYPMVIRAGGTRYDLGTYATSEEADAARSHFLFSVNVLGMDAVAAAKSVNPDVGTPAVFERAPRPHQAVVRYNGNLYHLGYYYTREAAKAADAVFRTEVMLGADAATAVIRARQTPRGEPTPETHQIAPGSTIVVG